MDIKTKGKKIRLRLFKKFFILFSPRRTGKTTACIKFCNRMKRKKTILFLTPNIFYWHVMQRQLKAKKNVIPLLVLNNPKGRITIYRNYFTVPFPLYNVAKGQKFPLNSSAFVIDEFSLFENKDFLLHVLVFASAYNIPFIITGTCDKPKGLEFISEKDLEFISEVEKLIKNRRRVQYENWSKKGGKQ